MNASIRKLIKVGSSIHCQRSQINHWQQVGFTSLSGASSEDYIKTQAALAKISTADAMTNRQACKQTN